MTEDRIVPRPRRRKGGARCPICGAPSVANRRPFCSTRCADVDLGRWLEDGYRIASDEAPAEGEANPDEEV